MVQINRPAFGQGIRTSTCFLTVTVAVGIQRTTTHVFFKAGVGNSPGVVNGVVTGSGLCLHVSRSSSHQIINGSLCAGEVIVSSLSRSDGGLEVCQTGVCQGDLIVKGQQNLTQLNPGSSSSVVSINGSLQFSILF
ncbi:MAG: hypothetical protein BWY72_01942 [Bacteroidetes bacterium ADurb.Bin416]|nr:MAG: hypothetical protein BWY72_01942 [Bacteroidetes bacterium ADurb.Bin416]